MRHTEQEIVNIKQLLAEMWQLVDSQIRKSHTALLDNNKELAHEVISREKNVNAYELSIDRECENFIALFNPVAVDLRFVLSLMKINNNLERMGDFAEGIARFVILNQTDRISDDLRNDLQLERMFEEVSSMFELCRKALISEDTSLASKVFSLDTLVDKINIGAAEVLAKHVLAYPEKAVETFFLYGSIRRLERMGDRCNNIAEDIIFYVDAKELRHIHK